MTKRFLDIRPLNLPPNNIISPSQGHPIITFDIAEQDAFLMGNSVRICGNLKITKMEQMFQVRWTPLQWIVALGYSVVLKP